MMKIAIRLLRSILPTKKEIVNSLSLFAMILVGALILFPVITRLPILGWDWYFFFTAHNPDYNLYSARSAYPPFARYAIESFTWIDDWRTSLYLVTNVTLLTVALCTWRAGGRWFSIFLSLFNGAVLLRLWAGHPDGLALMGFLTGFVPLALIKPQVIGWALLSSRKLFAWTVIFLLLSLIVWPMWPLVLTQATFGHEAAVGWKATGWQIPILGVALLAGAGKDPWRLMAAGSLISPYLTPSQMAVLAPSIGAAKGWKKLVIWFAGWMLPLGVGLGGPYKFLYFIFPLVIFWSLISSKEYVENVQSLYKAALEMVNFGRRFAARFLSPRFVNKDGTVDNRL